MKIEIFWSYMMFKCCQSKICFNCSQKVSPEKKNWGQMSVHGDFRGVQKSQKSPIIEFFGPPNIWNVKDYMHVLYNILTHYLIYYIITYYHYTAIKTYFTLTTFKHHIRPKNVNFHSLIQFIKRN